jgi:putative nucleotidyltransferase with HDIG domain
MRDAAAPSSRSGGRLLVVDDEEQLAAVLCETLAGLGHSVRSAGDGAEALRMLDRDPAQVVISDLRMPRMGGMELLEAASGRGLDADFIFLTGYGTVENAVECMRLGAADYLLKPFKLDTLAAAVDKVLFEREVRQERRRSAEPAPRPASAAEDPLALMRSFLVQAREVFAPDGMALMVFNGHVRRSVHGPLLSEDSAAVDWLCALGNRLAAEGRPKLLEPRLLGAARGVPAALRESWVMAAPVAGGGPGQSLVALVRGPQGPGWSGQDLRMLSALAAHASLSLEGLRACRRLQDLNMEVVLSHVRAVEAKDTYTCGHSERVAEYAVRLGRKLGLPEADLETLRAAGYLHDVGKIGVPDRVLAKPGRLTDVEMEIMRRHPALGREILGRVTTLAPALPAIEHHHERWDGRGYPGGLAGEAIPFLARVVSVVDAYEAITSDRAYQPARTPAEARRILARGAGGQWDPEVTAAWLALLQAE